jgi:uncharacterized protein YecA (UPF0149 family)
MDTRTGNLFEEPAAAPTRKGLVPAPHASRSQLHHMNVKPNENCPCGSGRKAKKCCRRARW